MVDFLFAFFTIRASEFAFTPTSFPIVQVYLCKLRVAQVSAEETGVLGRVLKGITTRKAFQTHCGSFVKNTVAQYICIEAVLGRGFLQAPQTWCFSPWTHA